VGKSQVKQTVKIKSWEPGGGRWLISGRISNGEPLVKDSFQCWQRRMKRYHSDGYHVRLSSLGLRLEAGNLRRQ
jgi:hypothetical protein